MLAFAVLLLALLSRFLPLALHPVSWNFTALGGGLLFFGAQLGKTAPGHGRSNTALRLAAALLLLMATDVCLTVFAYHYPFHVRGYLVTWAWDLGICLLSMGLLARPTAVRVLGGVLASATSFFLISNFSVWLGGHLYPKTLAGLGACYIAAVPFYRNDLVSTALTAGVLFGVPALVNLAHPEAAPSRARV